MSETWEGDSAKARSGTNVWTFVQVDEKRGIAYLPVGAPTFDRWGADRKGANLYSNSVVAVDAATGKYLWHFQTVHHDIWDLDLPRSEEHTSELQSLMRISYAVFCLKKKK